MAEDDVQENCRRVRPPRVHITYDLEDGDTILAAELPFVIGVLADLAGERECPALRDRKFVEVDRANFGAVVAAYAPRLVFAASNRLEPDRGPLRVELEFGSMADFEPASVARQVPGLTEALTAGRPGAAEQMDEILHAPPFQRLEASWRGLWYLVSESATSGTLKIRVLHATRQELLADLREAASSGRGDLARKVLEEPYRFFRGEPFGVLMGDYEFSHEAEDLELLEGMAGLASAALAPFLAAAGPGMFGWEDFSQVEHTRRLREVLEAPAYARWRSFRRTPEAAYAALVLPRILLRLPFSEMTMPVTAFRYEETVGDRRRDLLWGNAAFAMAARLAEAFYVHHWCAAITGVEGGGLVSNLPTVAVRDPRGGVSMKGPVEVPLDDIQEKELADAGFNGLVQWKGTDMAVFFAATSCLEPARYAQPAATVAARLAVRLPYILAVSRFGHYLKCMARDKTGSAIPAEMYETFANCWINGYVLTEDSDSMEIKAKRPLREARIEASENPDCPGQLLATAFLRPHFQVEDPGLALRLFFTVPAPVRGCGVEDIGDGGC